MNGTSPQSKIRVFISYAQVDGREFAERLHDDLERRGIQAFLDLRDIREGEEIPLLVSANLREAHAILAVLTPGVHGSRWAGGEQSAAADDEIPILPLVFAIGPKPLPLNPLKHLDFRGDYAAALETLVARLATIEADHLEYLKLKLDELLRQQAGSSSPKRFEPKIERLRANITNWAAKGESPAGTDRVRPEQLASDRDQITGARPPIDREAPVVGIPLSDIATHFRNRETEAGRLAALLSDPATRVVTVIGRGGIGKSALVAHVLRTWPRHAGDGARSATIEGIVHLSASSRHDIDSEDIVLAFAELLGRESGERLTQSWSNPALGTSAKVQALLRELRPGRRYVLFLDNVEDLLDEKRRFTDEILDSFIDACVSVGSPLVLLMTSRTPVAFRKELLAFDNQLSLTLGLPPRDGAAMLRALDISGQSGLRDLPEATLLALVRVTRGLPRALELVAYMLASDPLLPIEDLVTPDKFFQSDDVVRELVIGAYARLDESSLSVLQALAIFGRFVSPTAVEILLEPFIPTATVRRTLRHLVLIHAASANRPTGTIGLHPLDRAYALATIPATGEYTRQALHHRAADYYAAVRRPEADWKNPHDLRPQLLEFRHRMAAGDYDQATVLLGTLDENYLEVWGYNQRLVTMRRELATKDFEAKFQMKNLVRLARAEHRLGDFALAIETNRKARDIARLFGDRDTEATCLNYIGINLHFLGEYARAIECHTRALDMVTNEPRRKAACLNALGNAYNQLGAYDQAAEMHDQAILIRCELDNRRWLSDSFQNRGELQLNLGNLTQAFADFTRELPETLGGGQWSDDLPRLTNRSLVLIERGEYAQARDDLTRALALTRRTLEWRWEDMQRGLLADIERHTGEYERAAETYRKAIELAAGMGSRQKRTRHALGLAALERLRGRYGDAATIAREALDTAVAIRDATGQARARAELTLSQLLMGELEPPRVPGEAQAPEVPALQHRILLLEGLVSARRGEHAPALTRFQSVLDHSARLLDISPGFVAAEVSGAAAAQALSSLASGAEPHRARAAAAWKNLEAVLTAAPGVRADVDQLLALIEALHA